MNFLKNKTIQAQHKTQSIDALCKISNNEMIGIDSANAKANANVARCYFQESKNHICLRRCFLRENFYGGEMLFDLYLEMVTIYIV